MNIGKFFTLEEFCVSQTAARNGIIIDPTQAIEDNLTALVTNVLDPFRELIGQPLVISSGYRPPSVNKLVGGAVNSQHVRGQAADVTCPHISVSDLCKAMENSGLPFDQLIHEFGAWMHVSFSTSQCRGSILTASRNTDGHVMYSNGLPD
jgi:zinc D-Ala-D-Ala carboxypeptidase